MEPQTLQITPETKQTEELFWLGHKQRKNSGEGLQHGSWQELTMKNELVAQITVGLLEECFPLKVVFRSFQVTTCKIDNQFFTQARYRDRVILPRDRQTGGEMGVEGKWAEMVIRQ